MKAAVLIAEADADLREIYQLYFSDCGLNVETAADDRECVRKIRILQPDALIVDLELPSGGGERVIASLREGGAVPVHRALFVTGDHLPEQMARRSGVARERCFQKPFRMQSLLDRLLSATVSACLPT